MPLGPGLGRNLEHCGKYLLLGNSPLRPKQIREQRKKWSKVNGNWKGVGERSQRRYRRGGR